MILLRVVVPSGGAVDAELIDPFIAPIINDFVASGGAEWWCCRCRIN